MAHGIGCRSLEEMELVIHTKAPKQQPDLGPTLPHLLAGVRHARSSCRLPHSPSRNRRVLRITLIMAITNYAAPLNRVHQSTLELPPRHHHQRNHHDGSHAAAANELVCHRLRISHRVTVPSLVPGSSDTLPHHAKSFFDKTAVIPFQFTSSE